MSAPLEMCAHVPPVRGPGPTYARAVAYRCEVMVYPVATPRVIPLGARQARSPRLALRWPRERAEFFSRALGPTLQDSPFLISTLRVVETPVRDVGEQLRDWASDRQAQEKQLHLLRFGGRVSVTATGPEAVYALTARQVWIAPASPSSP